MRGWLTGMAVVFLSIGSGAIAADRNASGAIVAGDYGSAERILAGERRIFPNRPELMLNLAAVYRQTGRDTEARALYAEVLSREDTVMDMVDSRTKSSHAVAQSGLLRLSQMAAR